MAVGLTRWFRQVGVCLKHLPDLSDQPDSRYNGDTVPWQRVISSKGTISPRYASGISGSCVTSGEAYLRSYRGVGGAARQETALLAEGVEVGRGSLGERTVDFSIYGWFPHRLPSDEEDEDGDEE